MKVTKLQLKRIIKEELESVLKEVETHSWTAPGYEGTDDRGHATGYGTAPSPLDPDQEQAAYRQCQEEIMGGALGGQASDYTLLDMEKGGEAAWNKCMSDKLGIDPADIPGTLSSPDFMDRRMRKIWKGERG